MPDTYKSTAIEMADIITQIESVKEAKKANNATYNAKIKELEAQLDKLSRSVSSGAVQQTCFE